ncbi:MAG: type II toxin-antitoxin system VapC family toxin [Holophagaceae bacterium]
MIYLDTSALVKLFAREDFSDELREAVRGQAVRTASIAFVEALSAFARKAEFTEAERVALNREFLATWHRFRAVPTDDVLEAAGVLVRGHRLRAFDALHLAAARSLGAPSRIRFAVYDRELARAAAKEGFGLITDPGFGLPS